MQYNRHWVKNYIRTRLRIFFSKITGYYVYPQFRVARDLDFMSEYDKYGSEAKFVNLGAGEYFFHPRWDNYDLYQESLVKNIKHYHNYDLRKVKDVPFPVNNVTMFHCAHTFEHIPVHLIGYVVKRIFDSLESGGVLRVVVPNAQLILSAYRNKDYDFFKPYASWFEKRSKEHPVIEDYLVQLIATPKCRFYNEKIRHHKPLSVEEVREKSELPDNEFLDFLISDLKDNNSSGTDHLNWFSAEKLIHILESAGFSDVYQSAFGQSKAIIMRQIPLFDETLPYLSLYVEAKK